MLAHEIASIPASDINITTFATMGGMFSYNNGVRAKHLPSGLVAECSEERSRYRNKERAMAALALLLMDWDGTVAIEGVDGQIPKGWEFYTADFSLRSSGKSTNGSVALIHNKEGRDKWHALSEEEATKAQLYSYGTGPTFETALAAAVNDIREEK